MAKKQRTKDNTAISISALEAEKRELYKTKANPKRLAEVIAKLEWIYYGRVK